MLHVTHEAIDDRASPSTSSAGSIEVWTVDRPRAANALDRATFAQLGAAIAGAEARLSRGELLRGVVIASTARGGGAREVFLSGADLREVEAVADERTARAFALESMELLSRLEDLGCLVVAAISGDVYGGGCELVLACDQRVLEEGAQLAFRQTRIGLASGWGATTRLPRLVGLAAAKRLLLVGAPCPASEALRIGLVDELVERGSARARALELVRTSSEGAPRAIAAMKRGLRESASLDRETSLARELDRFVATWSTRDHREALAALRDKRPARFNGM